MTEQPEAQGGANEPSAVIPAGALPARAGGVPGGGVPDDGGGPGHGGGVPVNGVEPFVAAVPDGESSSAMAAFGWGDPVAPRPPELAPENEGAEVTAAAGTHRLRWIVGAVAGAVLVGGAAVAAAYGPTAYDILREKDTTLSAPIEAAGLHLDESQEAAETADYLRTALAADLGLRNPLGAVYTDPAGPSQSVIIVGGTGVMRSPGQDLGRAFQLFADGDSQVAGVRDVDPGALGGVMRCGTLAGPSGSIAVCGWADHGALAIAMFPGRSADDSAPLLRDMRSAIQRRN